MKLKSVFWSVARCTVGILQETIRNLCFVNKTDKGKSVQREAAVNSARFLTAAVGMLTSEIHSGNVNLYIYPDDFGGNAHRGTR